jgi:hypothetical protein
MESVQFKFEKRDKIHRDISVILIIAMTGLMPLMKSDRSLWIFLSALAVPATINFYLSYRNHKSAGKEKEMLKRRALILAAGLLILLVVSLI